MESVKTFERAKAILSTKAKAFVTVNGRPDTNVQAVKRDLISMVDARIKSGEDRIRDYNGNAVSWMFYPDHFGGLGALFVDGGF